MNLYKETAYNYIKQKIITCEYKPEEVLDLNAIKDQLNISRTPIRDAISSLEQERLVTVLPRRGVLVASVTPKDIGDLYVIREQLEPCIARMATPLANSEELMKFKELFQSREWDMKEFNQSDLAFHSYLVNLVENPYISSVMNLALSHNMRFVVLGAKLPNRLEHSNEEHIRIIDAMLERNKEEAEHLMRQHIEYARISAFQSMSMPISSIPGITDSSR